MWYAIASLMLAGNMDAPDAFGGNALQLGVWEVIPPIRRRAGDSASGLPDTFRRLPAAGPRRRPSWAAAPATYLLVGINCAVFLAMVLHGVSPAARPSIN